MASSRKSMIVVSLARLRRELLAFDLLVIGGHDIRALAWSRRRELLEELARTWTLPLNLFSDTLDGDLTEERFRGLPSTGVEHGVNKIFSCPLGPGPFDGRVWRPRTMGFPWGPAQPGRNSRAEAELQPLNPPHAGHLEPGV
jgi:hypothetical protein